MSESAVSKSEEVSTRKRWALGDSWMQVRSRMRRRWSREDRRNQPGLVAKLLNLPPPVMRPPARLHHHQTRRLQGEDLQHLCLRELAAQHRPSTVAPCTWKLLFRTADVDHANVVH